jgi:hypothetical protein
LGFTQTRTGTVYDEVGLKRDFQCPPPGTRVSRHRWFKSRTRDRLPAASNRWHDGNAMDRPQARQHHQYFKCAIVSRALHRSKDLVASCTAEGLAATWNAIGAALPSEERIAPEGLAVKILGNADGPVIMITLPPPERPNEAYYLCIVPAGSQVEGMQLFPPRGPEGTSCFRVFGMERSMLLDGGLSGFVVDWTASRRRNYDAPDDPSPGAFWEAVAQVIAGTRRPIHTTGASIEVGGTEPTAAHRAAAAIAELDRSTWLAGVGQPLPLGFPERFANARMVGSWGEAMAMLATPERADATTGPMLAIRTAMGEEAYGPTIARLASTTQGLLVRKLPRVFATPEENHLLSMFLQLDLIGALLALEQPALTRFLITSELLFLYAEGRLPCAWEGERITAFF